ncbi:MAG: hypothetical protein COU63_03955 [Candidatus Pacebacteria bacterium CG10_big_fil_rev_8_21_14_0_10_36_11]|nr:GNAT family N-acetyltransferase [Candidatus Pacearchaeota archaeon]OIP74051.1 MAG: hypothetical protein AUK08_02230 [Candidatus Pacebacteria bacterium CG2_30_36_39]PIR64418.1 MAG: hypothetical protein COU63_03955 [Candidatus Pacebacteria bacterium CG10_big_fil_rev_8_21_14_0_10_36_11]PJC43179.1 MAG: hypothetical protein CO040_00605 [Candidatus Pacebacteria bacterium CG_4_9_14_0_2_um_filter_36_8]
MKITLRPAKNEDLAIYTNLLQESYQDSYVSPEIGLTPACFAKEIFQTEDTQKYLATNLVNNELQQTWLAFNQDNLLIGSITLEHQGNECELRGFYVKPGFQGQGMGKKLWQQILPFSRGKDIILNIYAHNLRTIDIYKNWGFKVDKTKPAFFRHWPEWPDNVQAKCIYMRLIQKD